MEFKYESEDYIDGETESIDKSSSLGQQIVCEYAHQIEVDEYHEDEEDALDTSQYEQRLVSTSGNSKSSSVYYISAPANNSSTTNMDTQPQSSQQRQPKLISSATVSAPHSDPDERFLLSCLPSLKRLSTQKNALARFKIQELLYQIEFDEYSDVNQ